MGGTPADSYPKTVTAPGGTQGGFGEINQTLPVEMTPRWLVAQRGYVLGSVSRQAQVSSTLRASYPKTVTAPGVTQGSFGKTIMPRRSYTPPAAEDQEHLSACAYRGAWVTYSLRRD